MNHRRNSFPHGRKPKHKHNSSVGTTILMMGAVLLIILVMHSGGSGMTHFHSMKLY